jgi:hypothetical protein
MIKQIFSSVIVVFITGVMSWMCYTLISLDKTSEITSFKVSENHRMIKPLWEDFIRRRVSNDYSSVSNEKTDYYVTVTEEEK